jgi:hypothetical protein
VRSVVPGSMPGEILDRLRESEGSFYECHPKLRKVGEAFEMAVLVSREGSQFRLRKPFLKRGVLSAGLLLLFNVINSVEKVLHGSLYIYIF